MGEKFIMIRWQPYLQSVFSMKAKQYPFQKHIIHYLGIETEDLIFISFFWLYVLYAFFGMCLNDCVIVACMIVEEKMPCSCYSKQ